MNNKSKNEVHMRQVVWFDKKVGILTKFSAVCAAAASSTDSVVSGDHCS